MKSRVTFDLDGGNNPIILAHAEHSDDVRDKIAKRFVEKLGHSSNLAVISFMPQSINGIQDLHISPLPSSAFDSKEVERLIYDVSLDQLREFADTIHKEIIKREFENPEFNSLQSNPKISDGNLV